MLIKFRFRKTWKPAYIIFLVAALGLLPFASYISQSLHSIDLVYQKRTAFPLHYVRFLPADNKTEFRFIDFLSVMSAVQNLKPDTIILHGDFVPTGDWWKNLTDRNLVHYTPRNQTKFVGRRLGQNKEIGFKEHSADIAKLDILLQHGGVTADFDIFFIRGERMKDILKHKKAITCRGDEDGYNIGLIGARKDSKMLWAWRQSYRDIYVNDWNFNQGFVSKYLSTLYRDEVYVLDKVCNNPHPSINLGDYFQNHGKINWTNSVAIHSYERFGGVTILKPEDLFAGNMTTHKELLLTIYENRPLPKFDPSFVDEVNPLYDYEGPQQ